MENNKYLKFEEDNSYKETLDVEYNKLKTGEITKQEFLEKYINRHEYKQRIPIEEYKTLPILNHDEVMSQSDMLTKTAEDYVRCSLGPFRISDKIPNKREDGTGIGAIMVGSFKRLGEDSSPELALTMKMVDVVF